MDGGENNGSQKKKRKNEDRDESDNLKQQFKELSSFNEKLVKRLDLADSKVAYLENENADLRRKLEKLIAKEEESIKLQENDDEMQNDMNGINTQNLKVDAKTKNANRQAKVAQNAQKYQNPGCSNSNDQEKNKVVNKFKHIPIITTYNINIKDTSSLIERTLGHNNFHIKIMSKNATNVGVCTLEDFEKVKALFVNTKINFYTYTPKGQRPFSLVIEGLSGTYSIDDVRMYLDGLQIKLEINLLTKLNNDRWLLQVSRDSDLTSLYTIRYILRCKVALRKFKRSAIVQCFNCQRFGHTSANCNMPYRCVKCGESHGPNNCRIPDKEHNNEEFWAKHPITGIQVKNIGIPVKCVNCGVEGHTAGFKQCPRRIEILQKLESRKSSAIERERSRRLQQVKTNPANTSANVKAGFSYASALASNIPTLKSTSMPLI